MPRGIPNKAVTPNSDKKVPQGEATLRSYEKFAFERLGRWISKIIAGPDDVPIVDIAAAAKGLRVFIEQTVYRIAYRNGWEMANPNIRIKRRGAKAAPK